MTVAELIEKLNAFNTPNFEVKVLESVSGDLVEINNVNISAINGGEVHISIELEYDN